MIEPFEDKDNQPNASSQSEINKEIEEEIEVEPELRPQYVTAFKQFQYSHSFREEKINKKIAENEDETEPNNLVGCSKSIDGFILQNDSQETPSTLKIPDQENEDVCEEASINEIIEEKRENFSYSLTSSAIRDSTFQIPSSSSIKPASLRIRSITSQPSNSKASFKPTKTVEEDAPVNSDGFSCNICFDTASNPVLTLCGHLFCWPCLHQWLRAQARNPLCPVCKAGCGKDKVIPVYGRGSEGKDPRRSEPIPDRPKAQRPEPQSPSNPRTWSDFFSGNRNTVPNSQSQISFHAGLGMFPSLSYHYTSDTGSQFYTTNGSSQQAFLSRLFLLLALLIFISSLFG